ncbi:MAG: transposase [Mycobacteriales bacterium]
MKTRITEVLSEQPSHVQDVFGLGAVTSAMILGEVGDVRRFPSKHHFASYTGTAPIDASSGDTGRHRLNRGGNRRLNHVLHIAATAQISNHVPGYDYYLRKRAAGKSPLEAVRCLKRRLSNIVFRALLEDLEQRQQEAGPEGHSEPLGFSTRASGSAFSVLRRTFFGWSWRITASTDSGLRQPDG